MALPIKIILKTTKMIKTNYSSLSGDIGSSDVAEDLSYILFDVWLANSIRYIKWAEVRTNYSIR